MNGSVWHECNKSVGSRDVLQARVFDDEDDLLGIAVDHSPRQLVISLTSLAALHLVDGKRLQLLELVRHQHGDVGVALAKSDVSRGEAYRGREGDDPDRDDHDGNDHLGDREPGPVPRSSGPKRSTGRAATVVKARFVALMDVCHSHRFDVCEVSRALVFPTVRRARISGKEQRSPVRIWIVKMRTTQEKRQSER